MTQDNTLATLPTGIDFGSVDDLSQVEKLSTGGSYLPRIQIFGGQSKIVASGNPEAKIGTFGLVWTNEKFVNLGNEIDFLLLSFRVKALYMPAGDAAPISYFDVKSPEFVNVVSKADSTPAGQLSGYMYGPEYLMWVPQAESFASLFCGNKTLKRVSTELLQMLKATGKISPAAVHAKTKLIKTEKYSWWGMDVFPQQSPLPRPSAEDWGQQVADQVGKFRNPPKSLIEEDTTKDTRER